MRKLLPIISLLLILALILPACAPAAPVDEPVVEEPVVEEPVVEEPVVEEPVVEEPVVEEPVEEPVDETVVNPNLNDYTFVGDPDAVFDLNGWYADAGVEADVTIWSTGAVRVQDEMPTGMPEAAERYTIGFSVYYTVDEVGSMILDSMIEAAEEAGVDLLVNDANYDQIAQNQAIEQWILQDVDGVILAPCDFYGVKTALDALEAAGIPVITLNAPLAGSTYAVVTSDTEEQGMMAGELLENALLEAGKDMEGVIVYQNLPFVHPNAATRAKGFIDVFAGYPDIEIVELTGISPEDHYMAFEGAILAYPDMLGAWGLYSSATIGMLNAKLSSGMDDLLLSSIDQDKPILKGIYDGDIIGTAAYSSIWPSRWSMSLMVNLLNGADIPGVLFYQNMVITSDNVVEAFEHYYPGMTLEDYIEGRIQ